jgi:DNA-binding NarL/FixJ family response regulator
MQPIHSRNRLTSSIAVAIVEDDELLRDNLTLLIEGANGFRCVGSFASGEEAVPNIEKTRPDVVLMDIVLGSMSGIDCVRRLGNGGECPAVIMFTAHQQDELLFDALRAGASGYLIKPVAPLEVLAAIIDVHRGGAPMSRSVAQKIMAHFRRKAPGRQAFSVLSTPEREVLTFLASGYPESQIAQAMGTGLEAVRQHIGSIYRKLHVSNREGAIKKYLEEPEDSDKPASGGKGQG